MLVWMLTTFEDPRRPENFKGGYRRCTEMARLLRPHVDLRMVCASRRPVGDLSDVGVPWDNVVEASFPRRIAATGAHLLRHTRRGDVVLAYNPSLSASPALLTALVGRRLVVDYVDHQGVLTVGGWKQRATLGLRDVVAAGTVRAARRFVTSSATIETLIREANPRAAVQRYYGTLDRPRPAAPAPHEGPLRVLYLGSMMDISGADDLVEAVASLPSGTAQLELAGGGPHRPAVEKAVAAAVEKAPGCARFIELDDTALHPALRAADVLALPLRDAVRNRYNFPSRVVEFLWAGRPILATDIPPLAGFLRHGENAWVVPAGGPDSLAQGLRELAADPALRSELAARAERFFDETLAPDPSGRALADFVAG